MDRFTLREMLAQESLGLRLVTPSSEPVLDRAVMGAHGTEALHPVPWMQRDWSLLITGVRLVDRPDRQAALVDELADGGLAALGFGVGIDFDEVPAALVRAANARGFPVFEIPLRTPFREIIAFVNRSLLSTDLHYMRRLTSMREFLLDALQHPDPAETVVQRIASLLDGTAVLFSREGRVEAAVGPIAASELWHSVAAVAAGEEPIAVEGAVPAVGPVRDRDRLQRWLVVCGRPGTASSRYLRPLLETAVMVLVGLAGVQRITRGLERATHATFVADLLEQEPARDTTWSHRAAGLGVGVAGLPLRGVVIALAPPRGAAAAPAPPDPHAGERLLGDVEAALGDAGGLRTVIAIRDGAAYCVVEAQAEELSVRLDELARRNRELAIGVGRAVADVADVRTSLRDAEASVRSARERARRGPEVRWFEDLDLLSWLVTTAEESGLAAKRSLLLAPLEDDEVLRETLRRYLEQRLNAVKAARVLSIHPNSLRYRLSRAEERLGRSLQDPETIALLHIALRATGSTGL